MILYIKKNFTKVKIVFTVFLQRIKILRLEVTNILIQKNVFHISSLTLVFISYHRRAVQFPYNFSDKRIYSSFNHYLKSKNENLFIVFATSYRYISPQ